ncbi:hypothetical protein GCM10027610_028280 [Dactylosporangium cerinum]
MIVDQQHDDRADGDRMGHPGEGDRDVPHTGGALHWHIIRLLGDAISPVARPLSALAGHRGQVVGDRLVQCP